jgi:Xaa-Pro dipeptidase
MAKQISNPALPAPPSGKYPAKSHCRRVAKWLAENDGPTEGVIYLEGQALKEHEVCCWMLAVGAGHVAMKSANVG